MTFTTEKRRELTSSIISQNDFVTNSEKYSDNINVAFALKADEDKSNREIFITLNSELTGLSYEYKYLTGKYHPMLEESTTDYIDSVDGEFVTKQLWDSDKLQKAASLELGNEFHIDISESSTEYYPIHPVKYSHWVDDLNIEVKNTINSEQNIFDLIRTIISWYTTGGTSGLATDLTIYGKFNPYDLNKAVNDYMTVGYLEYITSADPNYMSATYDPSDDVVLINPSDMNNFCLGKVIGYSTKPARVLVEPYFTKGIVPNNSLMTSVHPQGNARYITIANIAIDTLESIYNSMVRYLSNNPNRELADNVSIISNLNSCLALFTTYRSGNPYDTSRMTTLVNGVEALRVSIKVARSAYINNFLITQYSIDLYEDRFKIIDMRLNKRMGTLRELMKVKLGISEISRITDEKKDQIDWFEKYFIVKRCEKDGDWKRRVFIKDPLNDFMPGDTIYVLSDNEATPEVKATIDVVVTARLEDSTKTTVDDYGDITKEYYTVKKLFFKDAWIGDVVKAKRFFSNNYLVSENFRVIKQIN